AFSHKKSALATLEHSDGAAVLRPAGNVVADRDGAFLAITNRLDPRGGHPARLQIILGRFGAAGAEGEIIFARAALVGVTLDGEGVRTILIEPARLLVERRLRRGVQFGGIAVEKHAVADIDHEILRRAWSRRASLRADSHPAASVEAIEVGGIFGAGAQSQDRSDGRRQ